MILVHNFSLIVNRKYFSNQFNILTFIKTLREIESKSTLCLTLIVLNIKIYIPQARKIHNPRKKTNKKRNKVPLNRSLKIANGEAYFKKEKEEG